MSSKRDDSPTKLLDERNEREDVSQARSECVSPATPCLPNG